MPKASPDWYNKVIQAYSVKEIIIKTKCENNDKTLCLCKHTCCIFRKAGARVPQKIKASKRGKREKNDKKAEQK